MGINLLAHGYNDVQSMEAGEFVPLPQGGYVCKVVNAFFQKSKAGRDMLILFLDIAEGDFTGYFKAAAERVKKFDTSKQWDNAGIYRQLVFANDGRVSPFFKGLLVCFNKSNLDLTLNLHDFEPASLRGRLIGCVFAQEEYSFNGNVRTRSFIKYIKSVADIRNDNFNVPALKKLDTTTTEADSNIYDTAT